MNKIFINDQTRFIIAGLGILLVFGISSSAWAASIVNSKHNLSVSGPGTVKASFENEICIFCHTPHKASGAAPLWNRYESGQTYTPYQSSTAQASIGQPTGASKLCLSCHDGTVAMGMVRSRSSEIQFGPTSTLPGGPTNLQTDLSDDHPVSFDYTASLALQNPELKNPATLSNAVRLDQNSQLQCTSCHDPHNDEYGDFQVVNAINGNLCTQCHNKTGWTTSLHKTSSKTWNGISPDPWPHSSWTNVSENSCENCHRPHGAGGKARLLNYASEEQNCLACHNGNVAVKNISAEFSKLSIHPVSQNTGAHDPAEPALMGSSRHVECMDCHNPHAANDQDGPNLPGSLQLVKGINAQGIAITQISYEYELCFRCHSDSPGATSYVNRQYPEKNTRLEFDPANASYHPVESVGRNPNVPSLISPYTTSSIIRCTSCHNNNTVGGPNGVHGSTYRPLLERQLLTSDGLTESPAAYALCYKCHDRNNILDDRSFDKHKRHVEDERIACTACHDPHGVRSVTHLINFDRSIVTPDSQGRLLFQDLGQFRGRCYLTCHGVEHDPKEY